MRIRRLPIVNHFMKKKKVKPKKPLVKQYFLQPTYQWRKDIFVCTGLSAKQMLAKIKTYKPKQWIIDHAVAKQEQWKTAIDSGCAFVSCEPTHHAFFVRLREYEDTWEFWETLLHELNHLVDMMGENQNFNDETEAKAYLQEFLFKEIRQKLQGIKQKRLD